MFANSRTHRCVRCAVFLTVFALLAVVATGPAWAENARGSRSTKKRSMKPRSRFMRSPDSKSIARSMSWLCAKDDGPLSGAFGAIFFDQTALTIVSTRFRPSCRIVRHVADCRYG